MKDSCTLAFRHYVMGGWQGLSAPEEYGGQGLLKQEMIYSGNESEAFYKAKLATAGFFSLKSNDYRPYLVPIAS